jgi:putative colanic acid biosynthesis acetyltransferase WcaB
MHWLFQDWAANSKNPKGRLVMAMFRLACALRHGPRLLLPLTLLYGVFYRLCVEWFLGIELPWKTRVGPGLRLDHGQALVINDGTVIGSGCHLRSSTTIGNKRKPDGSYSGCPVIGNGVDVGSNAVILGEITIGDHAVVGAGAVVVHDVPGRAAVAGNPARVLRIQPSESS